MTFLRPFFNERPGAEPVDLWDTDRPAFGMNGSCQAYVGTPDQCEQPGTNPGYTVGPEMIYEEKIFVDRVLQVVDEHPVDVPLFLNYDSHIVHSPLQAPGGLFHTFDFMTNDYDKHRQLYASMVAYLDTGVGKIVDALVDGDMWDDTIWFCRLKIATGPWMSGSACIALHLAVHSPSGAPFLGMVLGGSGGSVLSG